MESETDHPAWAVWVGSNLSDSEIYAVTGDSEADARKKALNRAEGGDVAHIDGPYQDSEPGVWEFEFVTEHRETVVVEAPNQDYATETAESERTYRGNLVQTLTTTARRLDVDPNAESVATVTEGLQGDQA